MKNILILGLLVLVCVVFVSAGDSYNAKKLYKRKYDTYSYNAKPVYRKPVKKEEADWNVSERYSGRREGGRAAGRY